MTTTFGTEKYDTTSHTHIYDLVLVSISFVIYLFIFTILYTKIVWIGWSDGVAVPIVILKRRSGTLKKTSLNRPIYSSFPLPLKEALFVGITYTVEKTSSKESSYL